ncbi:MAG TPA: hypothetical protein VF980_00750 [Thermoanaerobaculia bacterium]
MSRKVIVLAIAALSLVPAVFGANRDASAASLPSSRSIDPQLAALFAARAETTVTGSGMMVTTPSTHFVMLAKRADDGSIVTACVDSAEAAEAFLHPKSKPADPRVRQEK